MDHSKSFYDIDLNNFQAVFGAAIRLHDVDVVQSYAEAYNHYLCNNPHSIANVDILALFIAAIKTGRLDIISKMLNLAGLNMMRKDETGKLPIHHAAMGGFADIVKIVIDQGSFVNTMDNNGYTALHYAAQCGHKDVIEVLLKEGAIASKIVYDQNCAAIHLSVSRNQFEATYALLRGGADVNIKTRDDAMNTPLHMAIYNKNLDMCELLIQSGADLGKQDGRGRPPIHYACEIGWLPFIYTVTRLGVKSFPRDSLNRKPIHVAVSKKHEDIVQYLLTIDSSDKNARDGHGVSPLLQSIISRSLGCVELLIDAGADVNMTEPINGETALNLAVGLGLIDIVEYLLAHGADPNIANNGRVTPLHRCQTLKGGNPSEFIQSLLMHGAKLNSVDKHGYTPLDRCVFAGFISNFDTESLKLMISAGAYLKPFFAEVRRYKNSPLCWLVRNNDFESAKFLINAGWNLREEGKWLDLLKENDEQEKFLDWMRKIQGQPRTLMHLSRLSIREHLNKNLEDKEILSAIEELPLPTLIKRYIKFEEEADLLK